MKYAFVVPRYGLEVVGGAELGARMLAERLAKRADWSVEIFTTCAKDHMTWANEYPAGSEEINGVTVRRFETTSGRPPKFFPYSERVLSSPGAATVDESELFLHLQGPECPGMTEALVDSDRDLIAFYPYLYTTTARNIPKVAPRALMHPAAHDEPALHLPIYRDVFAATRGLVFQTYGERALVQSMFPVGDVPQIVVGLGFEEPPDSLQSTDPGTSDSRTGDKPYLLCLGRVDGFKGSSMLRFLQGTPSWPIAARHGGPGNCPATSASRRRRHRASRRRGEMAPHPRCDGLCQPLSARGVLDRAVGSMEPGPSRRSKRPLRGHARALRTLGGRSVVLVVSGVRGDHRPHRRRRFVA
jgi:hypothetical protein